MWVTISLGSSFYRCIASSQWPTTAVRVTASTVNTGASNMGQWWQPDVTYEYQVDGSDYRSQGIRFIMPPFYSPDGAREIQADYPQGAQVRAFYNPRNPAQSVLEPGVPPGMWIRLILPVFFWSLIGYILYEIRHPERRMMLLPDVQPAGQE
jgi:hypothetical protein